MPLVNCPECNKEISDKAKTCPNCGFPLIQEKEIITPPKNEPFTLNNQDASKKKSRIFFICVFFALLITGGIISFSIISRVSLTKAVMGTQQVADQQTATAQTIATNNAFDFSQYEYDFINVAKSIYLDTAICNVQNNTISIIWASAINNGEDFNKKINEFLKSSYSSDTTKSDQEILNNKLNALQNPPAKFEEGYKTLVLMYADYSFLCNQSLTPSGTLIT